MPQPFRYRDVRDRLFAETHGHSDTEGVDVLTAECDRACCCQRSLQTWVEEGSHLVSITDWQQDVIKLTDLAPELLRDCLPQCPFATVHRSIRDDLSYLADMGWLIKEGQGRFGTLESCQEGLSNWPKMPERQPDPLGNLSVAQTWEVLRSLESISFVQPNLEIIIQSLWEQLTARPKENVTEPDRRIFIHLDYILSETMQEKVDTLQEQIERLWREGGGVIQFDYGFKSGHVIPMTVYPVCLHYARRAKYLSAYGHDPSNILGWHNYRLDRIVSPQLTLLAWDDSQVPEPLRTMRRTGDLPTTKDVNTALEDAWGFNFYLPRKLLIIRFLPAFAQRYVNQTERHPTFQPIAYELLAALVKQEIQEIQEQSAVLEILSQRNPKDAYYRAWIRLGDINIVMRLRDWRPNGEVIAPLALRDRMYQESKAELSHYETLETYWKTSES